MKEYLSDLILKFKKRKDRKESDCFVTEEILEVYQAGNNKTREQVIRWAFKRLRDHKTNPLVKNILVGFLYANRHVLTKGKRDELKEFIRSQKKGKRQGKHLRK